MNLKDYDDIKVPENLNDYIDKGIKKGIEYKSKSRNKTLMKVAAIPLISVLTLGTSANIPVLAKELVDIPVIGEIVKVLDFTESTQYGGMITDGNRIVIDSLSKNSINIYFTNDGKLIDTSPNYEVEYRKYPYTLVFNFRGVRYLDFTYIEDKVEKLPFVKDVYKIMTLDDSSYRVAIELKDNVDFKVIDHKEPAMLQIKLKSNSNIIENKKVYFIRTQEMDHGEQLGFTEEMLYGTEKLGIQKTNSGKYIVQIGPFNTIDEAKDKLKELNKNLGLELFIESRNLGEGPK